MADANGSSHDCRIYRTNATKHHHHPSTDRINIQTVSEATRFKYIEDMINHHLDVYNFPLDFKVLDLENNWETISTAIITANQLTGQLNRPLLLVNADGTNRVVWNVAQIRDDIGLLHYFYWRRSSDYTDEWPMKLKQVVDDVVALA
uniref:rRNA N-glycosylase n=1 Tax=Opuntia streptacantha TaxID=393608 RepID=A0A7C9CR86_OPUST